MTNREAIKMLKTILRTVYLGNRKFIEAVEKAISALEKQTADKCCETCKYKNRNSFEEPCDGCYFAYDFEDCYKAEEES